MPFFEVNPRSLISPLGIIRFFEIFFACTAFSLVSVYPHITIYYSGGVWCMFTWCFCFAVTLLILLAEFIGVAQSLPISWQDFTSAFSMLAVLMTFTTSVVYPSIFIPNCSGTVCAYRGAATAMSILCFIAYAVEVGFTRAKSGEVSSFLATVPGLLKVFEAYVACLIFSLVTFTHSYQSRPGLQWCVAVYSICFIITTLIIILTVGRCLASLPFPLEKFFVSYNILAVLMYITATFVWPIYSFRDFQRTDNCNNQPCEWNNRLGVTFLTIFNLIAYAVDLFYSSKMVFVTTPA